MNKHYCHAVGCPSKVPQKLIMCAYHWHKLNTSLRQAIWREYRPDQEIDETPSEQYLAAMNAAIEYIRKLEAR